MLRIIFNKYILVFVLIVSANTIHAQEADSLQHYLRIAAYNNHLLKSEFAVYEASLQKIPQAGAFADPQLEIGFFLQPMDIIDGKQVADFKLMQMFPWFGVLKNAKDEMSLMAKANYEQFRDAKLQVCYDAQRTWFDLYKIRQDIRISQENVDLLKTIERLTLVKFRSGSLSSGSTASSSGGMSGGSTSASSTGSSGIC